MPSEREIAQLKQQRIDEAEIHRERRASERSRASFTGAENPRRSDGVGGAAGAFLVADLLADLGIVRARGSIGPNEPQVGHDGGCGGHVGA